MMISTATTQPSLITDKINKKSSEICAALLNYTPTDDVSLLGGDSGIILGLAQYLKVVDKDAQEPIQAKINALLAHCVQVINRGNNSMRFSGGLIGFSYVLNCLKLEKLIDFDDKGFLDYVDQLVSEHIIRSNTAEQEANLDYLHGLAGAVYYALVFGNLQEQWLPAFLEILDRQKKRMPTGGTAFVFSNAKGEQSLNLSVSHGNLAIFGILLKIKEKNLGNEFTDSLTKELLHFILSSKNKSPHYQCFFPDRIPLTADQERRHASRLGWCYGDLMIEYLLIRYAKLFNDLEVLSTANKMAAVTMKRKLADRYTNVIDAGLCHGSAGVAYLYKRLSEQLNDESSSNAYSYWLDVTVNYFGKFADGTGGYKAVIMKERVNDRGFLMGAAGILTVFSNLVGPPADPNVGCSWDSFLML